MSQFADHHLAEPVPVEEQVSAFQIALVYIGIAITLPAFVVAAEVFRSLGLYDGLLALALSGAVLCVLAGLAMSVGATSRLSTFAIIEVVFGRLVALFVNALLAMVLLGWFAVTVSIFSDALEGAIGTLAGVKAMDWVIKLGGGALMILLTLYGFNAIERLSRIAVPLLFIVLAIQFGLVLSKFDLTDLASQEAGSGSIGSLAAGVSILVGAFAAGATISPDISRFARSIKDARLASLLSFGLGAQLVFVMAGLPMVAAGEGDFVSTLIALGLGWPALFVIIFATLTTNVSNLYSVTLGLGKIAPRLNQATLTIGAGSIATAMAVAGFEGLFVPFLLFLGVAIPPIAGVYIAQGLFCGGIRSGETVPLIAPIALISWLTASAIAWITTQGWFAVSGAPAVDAIAVSFVIYLALNRLGGTRALQAKS